MALDNVEDLPHSLLMHLLLLLLGVLKLVVHLLDHLVDQAEVFAQAAKSDSSVSFELIPQFVEVYIHAFVGKADLVHHDLADFEHALQVNHGVDLILVELEFVACNLVQLDLL